MTFSRTPPGPITTSFMPSGTSKAIFSKRHEALTRWTPENRDTNFPRLSYVSDAWNTIPSTRFLYSATYARLKNIDFSYSLPERLVGRWNLTDVRLHLSGENLLTFFAHDGLDPEQTVSGSTYYRYPAQKLYSVGLHVSF